MFKDACKLISWFYIVLNNMTGMMELMLVYH